MSKKAKISDLIFDDKNANVHTEKGMRLLEKSLSKLGAGRSVLIDKNNRLIAGNGVIETAGNIGLEDVIIVPTTGKEIVAVKRMDIDLDSKEGRELAIADNHVAKESIDLDLDIIHEFSKEYNINLINEWEMFDSSGQLRKSFTTNEAYSDKGLPFPITIIITEDDYNRWCEIKNKLKIKNDRDAFFNIIEEKR